MVLFLSSCSQTVFDDIKQVCRLQSETGLGTCFHEKYSRKSLGAQNDYPLCANNALLIVLLTWSHIGLERCPSRAMSGGRTAQATQAF
eukprot:4139323-Amphidinium_carterae.1